MRRLLPLLVVAAALALPATASAAPIDFSCTPAPASCDGWYPQPVTLTWTVSGTKAPGTCVDATVAVETAGSPHYCKVTAGPAIVEFTVVLKVDMTRPTVTGVATSRPPDHNGWYRKPVQVTFSGSDALSGLRGCSSTNFSSATAGAVNLVGRCQDMAGNVSAPMTFGLRYDATPPPLAKVRTLPLDDAVRLRWTIPGGASVRVWRTRPGGRQQRLTKGGAKGSLVDRRVRNGRRYTYTLTATDPAGNTARKSMTVVPGPRLLAPGAGARVSHPPMLRWTRVRGADYYNVQVFRGRHKILSAWPTRPRLQLERRWRYAGSRHRLTAGRKIRWFVWPGRGPRAASDYGRLVGTRTFTLGAP